AAQRGADGLAHDRALANAGVEHAREAVLVLQSGAALIDVAEFADVFTEDDDAWIACERMVEAGVDDLEAVEHRRVVRVLRLDLFDAQRRVGALAEEVTAECLVAVLLPLAQPFTRFGRCRVSS